MYDAVVPACFRSGRHSKNHAAAACAPPVVRCSVGRAGSIECQSAAGGRSVCATTEPVDGTLGAIPGFARHPKNCPAPTDATPGGAPAKCCAEKAAVGFEDQPPVPTRLSIAMDGTEAVQDTFGPGAGRPPQSINHPASEATTAGHITAIRRCAIKITRSVEDQSPEWV